MPGWAGDLSQPRRPASCGLLSGHSHKHHIDARTPMDNYKHPKSGMTYFSPSFTTYANPDRTVRIASKVIESPLTYAFAAVKDEMVLLRKEDAKTDIRATFYCDDRNISVLTIQGYTVATSKPHNASFSFVGQEIDKLLEFVANIHSYTFKGPGAVRITDDELRRIALSNQQARTLFEDNEDLFADVVRSSVTRQDIVAVGYRKKQLEVFETLLCDPSYFEEIKTRRGCTDESLWQQFFEKNPWIFGYGLSYIYLSSLDDRKLEQIVQGHHVGAHGKRVDALLKSRGAISSLCFVEIKTHKTALVAGRPYRRGCWAPSSELAGAVAQVQGSVAAALDTLQGQLTFNDALGNPTEEQTFSYAPKAYLVVGSLSEFVGEHGVNQDQFRSFELLRHNTTSPEIITFDELLERAKFIVRASES